MLGYLRFIHYLCTQKIKISEICIENESIRIQTQAPRYVEELQS